MVTAFLLLSLSLVFEIARAQESLHVTNAAHCVRMFSSAGSSGCLGSVRSTESEGSGKGVLALVSDALDLTYLNSTSTDYVLMIPGMLFESSFLDIVSTQNVSVTGIIVFDTVESWTRADEAVYSSGVKPMCEHDLFSDTMSRGLLSFPVVRVNDENFNSLLRRVLPILNVIPGVNSWLQVSRA